MKKSVVATILASVLTFGVLGTGCQIHASFDSLIPEEYGAWENNYIYHGMVRSKTTGEDGEPLISHVVTDEKTYSVAACTDSVAIGDELYWCLTLSDGAEMEYALVSFDVKTKKEKTLMLNNSYQDEEGVTHFYHPYAIERVYEDSLLLQGQHEQITMDEYGQPQTSYFSAYFKIAYDGEFLGEIAYNTAGYSRVSDDYFVKTVTNSQTEEVTLYYITWEMEEGLPICTFDNAEVYVEYDFVEKGGSQGFLLKTYGLVDDTAPENYLGEKLKKVEFFNLKHKELVPLYEGDSYVEWVEIPENEYFITYEYETITYKQKGGLFETPTEYTVSLKKNCTVSRIEYAASSVTLKTAYTFDKSMGLQTVKGVAGSKDLYVAMEWYENAAGCKKGGRQFKQYKVNLDNGKLETLKQEEWNESSTVCYGSYALENGVTCGDYAYYIERIKLTTVNDKTTYAYRLQRYNSKNKKTDVMQLWKGSGSAEGEKYCQMMWRNNGGDMDDFIVRNY